MRDVKPALAATFTIHALIGRFGSHLRKKKR